MRRGVAAGRGRGRGRGRGALGEEESKAVWWGPLKGPPLCDLWTPYLTELFPPRSRRTGSLQIPPFQPAVAPSSRKRKRSDKPEDDPQPPSKRTTCEQSWDFQFQPPERPLPTTENEAKESPEAAAKASDGGKKGTSAGLSGGAVGDFEELGRLLDGANLIYCQNQNALYGLLRATLGDVTDLSSFTWAPHTDIDDEAWAAANPLRPKPDDPYYWAMSPDNPIAPPTRDEVEGITRPSIELPPDESFAPLPRPERGTRAPSQESVVAFSEGSVASEYNAQDTKEDIERYLRSKRWLGSSLVTKQAPPYFRDSRMIHWFHKTLSVCGDLKLDDLSLVDIVAWNKARTWWAAPALHLARNQQKPPRPPNDIPPNAAPNAKRPPNAANAKKPPNAADGGSNKTSEMEGVGGGGGGGEAFDDGKVGDQWRYTLWHGQRRWGLIKEALEHEVRLVADVSTMLHYHKLPLVCHVRRWNRNERRFVMRWESMSVRFSTPSLLQFTSSVTTDPRMDSILGGGVSGRGRRGSRKSAVPRPAGPLPSSARRDSSVYNVVCALAVSNIRKHYVNGEWCDLMYLQNQHISMVVCLVISAEHPLGTIRFFSPTKLENK